MAFAYNMDVTNASLGNDQMNSCCLGDTENGSSSIPTVRSPLHLMSPITKSSSKFTSGRKMKLFELSIMLVSCFSTPSNALIIQNPNLTPSSRKDKNQALEFISTARLLHQQRHHPQVNEKGTESEMQQPLASNDLNRRIQSLTRNSSWENLFDDENSSNHKVILEQQDAFMTSRVEAHLPSLEKLRGSLGSEIPEMELYLQMEAARARARASTSSTDGQNSAAVATLAFMDLHHEQNGVSTSIIEKVAMSSLPSQLPGLATASLNNNSLTTRGQSLQRRSKAQHAALSKAQKNPKPSRVRFEKSSDFDVTNGDKNSAGNHHTRLTSRVKKIGSKDISTIMATKRALESNTGKEMNPSSVIPSTNRRQRSLDSSSPTARVSHEQEIQLARIVQRGVELHRVKSTFEEEHGRDITRQEWTELAELDSPRELRRIVSNYRKAKNKLVMANMGLVHAVVRSRMGRSGADGASYEELVQEGSLGLLRAAELFDPSRGLRFSTYATIWIKGTLGNNNLGETIKLPLREKTKFNRIQKAILDINSEKNDSGNDLIRPSSEEIAERCEFSVEEVEQVMAKMKRARNVLSLDYRYDSYSRSGVQGQKYDALANDKNLMDDVDLVEKLHVRADVIAALARNLDPREARLMRLRYGLNDGRTRSITDCAEAMGISRTRAKALAVGCLKKLREADDAESLQEYLLSVV